MLYSKACFFFFSFVCLVTLCSVGVTAGFKAGHLPSERDVIRNVFLYLYIAVAATIFSNRKITVPANIFCKLQRPQFYGACNVLHFALTMVLATIQRFAATVKLRCLQVIIHHFSLLFFYFLYQFYSRNYLSNF